ncbi:hypothetical protein S83_009190 [Arachis hypogaea]
MECLLSAVVTSNGIFKVLADCTCPMKGTLTTVYSWVVYVQHARFVRGAKPGHSIGFDIDEADILEMEKCNGVVVASTIFGKLGSSKMIGLWRIIVAHNLPYTDARRTGKLLLYRLVPNARYSIWVDGKLKLVVDPYKILERFLWRKNATFAISKHYRRFDVFVEAEANKDAKKYDNASINFQIEFYKREGLTPYTEAKLPLTSGCVVIREHVPISNLFTCLWFNEVDRFTSRDQISFSTVRDKILSKVGFHFNMFLDCERRNFVIQKYYMDILLRLAPPVGHVQPPPPPAPILEVVCEKVGSPPSRRGPGRRGRNRKTGNRRHRKVVAGSKDMDTAS